MAIDGFKEVWDINSPSRVMVDTAWNVVQGFVNGISRYGGAISDVTGTVGKNAVDTMNSAISKVSNAIDLGFDMSPTIRPVIDLSNVEASNQLIDGMLSKKQIDISSLRAKTSVISNGLNTDTQPTSNTSTNPQQSSNVSFVQNNYSPKELSRIDIYRQTKNQLIQLNGFGGVK